MSKKLTKKKKEEILTSSAYVTITSREIAEMTGKRHADVLRDIDNISKSAGLEEHVTMTTYTDSQNRKRRMALVTREFALKLFARYEGRYRLSSGAYECIALRTIEQMIGRKLLKQYYVDGYYIDGYDLETNTAYEIDEEHHKHQRQADKVRQTYIENVLGCTFVRIKLYDE